MFLLILAFVMLLAFDASVGWWIAYIICWFLP